MLIVDKITIREDWQRAIVERDIGYEQARLAALEENPSGIPIIEVLGTGNDNEVAVSAMANLLYSPDMPMAADRERKLLRHWPGQAEEAKRLLRRQIRIHQAALDEYDQKKGAA